MKFDLRQAMRNLNIEAKPWGYAGPGEPYVPAWELADTRGYSHDRWLTISPIERWPEFVTFHEMTHILLGHTTLSEKFGAERTHSVYSTPSKNTMALQMFRREFHDIFEAECHATAIITAQLTDTPFSLPEELTHLNNCYTHGRDIPEDVMKRAGKTAKKIARAGEVSRRNFFEKIAS